MGPFLYSLMFAAGAGMWVWVQVSRRTGHADPKSIAMSAGGAAFVAFVFFYTFFKFVLNLN
ncbi:hypothetical protein KDA23_01155 [Candidatus Saccharibacteria bacterium]|nr:hypothetical protein [Candidatus Saccharibacteria bacterium]